MLLMALFAISSTYATESDSLGEIGDNLDLHAVLDAFKNSESVESFEKTINDQSKKINNLDLNEDGEVDYIQVIDNVEEDAHAIILRVDMAENESQDVAVIEIEKTGDATVNVQIVGDVEIYGENYFVEPVEQATTTNYLMRTDVVVLVNVWHWSSVRFIYGPKYKRWVSPYRWHNHPHNWKPWKPYQWHTYHNFHKHHRHNYHVVHVHHAHKAHKIYNKHRKTSVKIKNHHKHHSHNPHQGHKTNGNHKNASKTNKGNNHQKQQGKKNKTTTTKQKTSSKKKTTTKKKN